jgi:hypothetical protein
MAQFKVFSPHSEVSSKMVRMTLDAVHGRESQMNEIFVRNHLYHSLEERWHPMQNYLNALKEIYEHLGPTPLFDFGKFFPKSFIFSGQHYTLEDLIHKLNAFYHNLHKGSDVGYYKLVHFDKEHKEARIECRNPYPCYFDRGILTVISKLSKPVDARFIHVWLSKNSPSRLSGDDVSYYSIEWV